MKISSKLFILVVLLVSTSSAWARNTEVLVDAHEAVERQGKGDLLDIPYFMKGQQHPAVKKKIGRKDLE